MKQSNTNTQNLKSTTQQISQKSIPSSFALNPQYFNTRLVRIKQKIDQIIKEYNSTGQQSEQVKTEFIKEEKGGAETSRSISLNANKNTSQLPVQKVIGETKQRVKNIYIVVMKDYNDMDTNTFELRSFMKDLKNQNKRLVRILPETAYIELQKEKKDPFRKSQVQVNPTQSNPKQLNKPQQGKQGNEQTQNPTQKQQLQTAKQLIEAQFKKRSIFKEDERYYEDHVDNRCKLFKCNLI